MEEQSPSPNPLSPERNPDIARLAASIANDHKTGALILAALTREQLEQPKLPILRSVETFETKRSTRKTFDTDTATSAS